MHYICQLNLTEAPVVPERLADIALLIFFIADFEKLIPGDCAPETWCLRTYGALEGLGPLKCDIPASAPPKLKRDQLLRGFEGRWLAATDHPLYDDPEFRAGSAEDGHVYATKLGGYPSNLQHAVGWAGGDFAFALQIDSEAKVGLNWVDRGFVYIGRSDTDPRRWAVSCQSY